MEVERGQREAETGIGGRGGGSWWTDQKAYSTRDRGGAGGDAESGLYRTMGYGNLDLMNEPDGVAKGNSESTSSSAMVEEWLRVLGAVTWGLGFASLFGIQLQILRWPEAHWAWPLWIYFLLFASWQFFGRGKPVSTATSIRGLGFCVLMGGLYVVRHHEFVPPMAGVGMAGYYWLLGRVRRRAVSIAVAGCLLASLTIQSVPWPSVHRTLLVLVCAGLAYAVQGAWRAVRYLGGERAAPRPEPTPGEYCKLLAKLMFRAMGRIEFEQTHSGSVVERVRRKRAADVAALEELGFEFLCCYSESFAAARLCLVGPLLVVLAMLRSEVIRLRGGKVHCYYMLLVSKDRTAFGDATGLGVKFHTALSDGTMLVTANYGENALDGPRVFRRCRKCEIREAWDEHRREVEAREGAGTRAIRDGGFAAFAELSHRESAEDLA